MDSNKQRETEIRKMVQQLNDKTRGLIESTASASFLGMQLEDRVKALRDMKEAAETLLKETIDVLTQEGYQKNRDMISYCFTNMTGIGERIDSAIRTIKAKPSR